MENRLAVLWTNGDREVALKVAFMYAFNAKRNDWWEEVELIVWGPSAKLLSEDKELQDYIKKMMEIGVEVNACKACADMYGVTPIIEQMDIVVKYMGVPLTNYLKSGQKVITF